MKNLIQKLLPLERILDVAMRIGLLKAPMEVLAKGWVAAQGVRTQILLGVAAAVAAAASAGAIPWDQAEPFVKALLAVAAPTALDKLARVLDLMRRGSEAVANEAQKP